MPNLVTLGRQGLFNHNNMDHSIYMGLCAADLINAFPPLRPCRNGMTAFSGSKC